MVSTFKYDFSKIFWGGAHRAPSPDPSSRFFLGFFALGLGFAVNSWALRALDSGFALNTRALRALDSGFTLNFRLGTLVWPPNKFLDPPLMPNVPNALVAEAPLQTPLGSLRCSPNLLIVGFEKKLRSGDASMTQGGVPPWPRGECLHDPGGIDAPDNH